MRLILSIELKYVIMREHIRANVLIFIQEISALEKRHVQELDISLKLITALEGCNHFDHSL